LHGGVFRGCYLPESGTTNKQKEEKMRTKFAIALAVAAVCVTATWAAWSDESMITGDAIADRQFGGGNMVFGPDGIGHLVWWNLMNGRGLNCNRYDPSSGWTPDYQVNPAGSGLEIALDADGETVHLVYTDSTICYRKCVRTSDGSDEWGPAVRLCGDDGASAPSVACVPGDPGHVVVCWAEGFSTGGRKPKTVSAIGFIECIDGAWGTPIRLDSNTAYTRKVPSIAVAPNSDVSIAYYGNDDNTAGFQVYVKTRHSGVWETTVDVTPALGSDQCTRPRIEASPCTGNPHVVFQWMRTIQISKKVTDISWRVGHAYRSSQGTWQTPESVSVPRHGLSATNSYLQPSVAFDNDGIAYVVWHEHYPFTDCGIMFSSCPADGEPWSAPAWVVHGASAYPEDACPDVAVDEAACAVHVAWKRSYSGEAKEIWWRSGDLGGDGPQAQPVALPQSRVELFPNPATAGRVSVQYALPHTGPKTVTLLDVSGRAVWSSEFGVLSSKDGSFSIDARGLNAGVYVVKLDAGATSLTRKLVIE
jgi:hypothetical protein